ncbi:MAG: type IX secretion system outer membrane channel protein PorV [Owenweeksia sp.]
MKKSFYLTLLFFSVHIVVRAQGGGLEAVDAEYYSSLRGITTAVPIIAISPDARAGGMGDVGVASEADINSIYWNPAKLAFLPDGTRALSISYTPWLNKLVNDINLAHVSGAIKIGDNQAAGLAMRYFSLGEINFRSENNDDLGSAYPYEMTLNGAYALKLSKTMSLAVGLRYIYSNLTAGNQSPGNDTKPGQTLATDIGYFFTSREYNMEGGMRQSFAAGLNISNVGGKISYSNNASADFIPTNLRIGGAYNLKFDKYNRMSFMVDVNKLLVPTPPLRDVEDRDNDDDTDEILAGKDDNVNSFQGIFQSFNDAPGGFSEELEELIINTGVEFWYDDRFAFRGGYQYEDTEKGGRKYFTIGLGLRYNVFGMDFAYLIPSSALVKSPLENTLRFTLLFDFEKVAAE